jgi:hypothetical protein
MSAPDFVAILKSIRGAHGGVWGVSRSRVEGLIALAAESRSHEELGAWRPAIRDLLYRVIHEVFEDSAVAEAVEVLLGLPSDTSQMWTEGRRQRAARAVGYQPMYFRRSKESDYLDELAAGLAVSHLTLTAEGSMRSAIEELIRGTDAQDPRLVQQALDCGLAPLLRLAQYPEEIRRDFGYRCELEARADGALAVYQGRAAYRSRRHLPAERLRVVMCRTLAALHRRFEDSAVISAEYTPLPVEAWAGVVDRGAMSSRVLIDGVEAHLCSQEVERDEYSMTFRVSDSIDGDRDVEIRNRYVHEQTYRELTIRLRNHFCFGTFEADLLVEDPAAADLAVYDYVAGVAAGDLRLYGRSGHTTAHETGSTPGTLHARVHAGPDAVIWPGSGVHFSWRSRELPGG